VFAQIAQSFLADLDAALRRVVSRLPDAPGFGVMLRYALGWSDEHDEPYGQPAGKRIRPILLLLCARAAGGDWRQALPAAAAVELLHNFSLIHDDIQDNSPTRHKRPTVWKVWGAANAINAGDALFTLSYCALEDLLSETRPEIVLKVWRVFNQTALDLTRGQHLDMRFETQLRVSVDDYLTMIQGKSAALVAACAQIGALIASSDESVAASYAAFGLNLGIAFQIRDDILGIWGDPTVTGKSAATDIIARKKSLPVLYGLSHSKELADIYERTSFTDTDVSRVVTILNQLGVQAYTQNLEALYYRRALEALNNARPQDEAAGPLLKLVENLFGRQY
jgi:geranylgeranyl diphosphate synthase type I